jgi:UDP-N-acetylmuramate--alanine ligase
MNLFLPSDPRPLHFVGIGGAGMGGLALIARHRGIPVTGSDADVSGCGDLIAAGASVHAGSAPADAARARAVIVSAAIGFSHPDLESARANSVPIVPRKQALAHLVGGGRCIGIAGTHGKTTTTVMTTEAVAAAGFPVTGIAGGRVDSWGGNARIGGTDRDFFVVEADEYDQAFLALSPAVAVITNVEADHLECYGSLEALEEAFVKFAAPAERVLIGNDSPGADRVASRLPSSRIWRFGPGARDVPVTSIAPTVGHTRATVTLANHQPLQLRLNVPGLHNVRNATAALGVVAAIGGDPGRALAALAEFPGVGRRFERLGEVGGVALVDDYAHHPTEIRATLLAARQAYPSRRLVAVFQPHLYSRTAQLGEEMGQVLATADLACITDVYAAREQPLAGVTGQLVADAARRAGGEVLYEPNRAKVAARVRERLRPGDLVLTMGAGDITRLGRELAPMLTPGENR